MHTHKKKNKASAQVVIGARQQVMGVSPPPHHKGMRGAGWALGNRKDPDGLKREWLSLATMVKVNGTLFMGGEGPQ